MPAPLMLAEEAGRALLNVPYHARQWGRTRPNSLLRGQQTSGWLPVWVQVAANLDADGALEDAVSRVVRERLLAAGFRLARMVNFGKRDEQRLDHA